MRTSSFTWACALVVMGLQGQVGSAQAAPARKQTDRPKYHPRTPKRQLWNGTNPLDSLLDGGGSPSPAPQPGASAGWPLQWTPPSEEEIIDDLVDDGELPKYGTKPIHTKYTLTHTGLFDIETKTYTLAYTPLPLRVQQLPSSTRAQQTTTESEIPAATSSSASNPVDNLIPGLLSPSPSSGQDDSSSNSSPLSNGLLEPVLGSGGLVPEIVAPQTQAPAFQTTTPVQNLGPSSNPIVVGLNTILGGNSPSQPEQTSAPKTSSGLLDLPPLLAPAPSPVPAPQPQQNTTASPSSTKPGLLDPILSDLIPSPNPAPSTTENAGSPQSDAPSSSPAPAPGLLDPLLGSGSAPSPSQTTAAPAPGILDPLLGQGTAPSPSQSSSAPAPGILDPLLGQGTAPSPAQSSSAPAPGILDPLLGQGTAPAPAQSSAPAPAPGLLDPLLGGVQQPTNSTTTDGGLLGGLLPQTTQGPDLVTISGTGGTFVVPKPTDLTGTGLLPQTTDQPGLIPGLISSLLGPSPTNTGTGAQVTIGPNATSALSSVASELSSHLSGILGPSQDPAASSSMSSELSSLLSSAASSLTGTGGLPVPSSFTLTSTAGTDGLTTAIPIPATTMPSNMTAPFNATTLAPVPIVPIDTTTTTLPTAEQTTAPPTTTSTSVVRGPQSILPIGTNTETALPIPTQIVFAAQTVSEISAGAAPTETQPTPGLPTYMPRLIQAPGGMPKVDSGSALIQVGFNYSLNFLFVVDTDNATSQIFAYLPKGISRGLNIADKDVVMNALMPYDTSATMGYITTLAQAYIPKDMVNFLQQALHAPTSPLYNSPDPPVRQLMSMVNPAIPLIPGASLGDGPADLSGSPDIQAAQRASNAGAPIGGDPPTSSPVRGSTVGIGVGAVAGAAVYAAAMVFVARRYRQKKRTRHSRNLSAPTAERGEPRMSEVSGGGMGSIMSGAHGGRLSGFSAFGRYSGSGRSSDNSGRGSRGSRNSGHSSNSRSVRDQGISNPIMSENSLGWN